MQLLWNKYLTKKKTVKNKIYTPKGQNYHSDLLKEETCSLIVYTSITCKVKPSYENTC